MGHTFYRGVLLTVWVSLLLVNIASSQDKKEEPLFPTQNTSIDSKTDPGKYYKNPKPIRYIITNDTQNILSGNRCFEEETRRMGFQYLAVPKGQPANRNGWSRWWNNFGVKWVILWKNGPFWKSKVNKKFEECMYGSGDHIG